MSKKHTLPIIEKKKRVAYLEHNSIHTHGPPPPPTEDLIRLCHTYKIVGSSGEIVRAEHVE